MAKIIKKATTEIVAQEQDKDIVAQPNQIANFNVESLMAKAIENGLSAETMEKFLAMRMQLKQEWAKEQFNKAMAAFQADCPTIQKNKEVKDNNGKILYSYAPIESIVSQVKSLLQQHGFSYSTGMEVLADGIKVVCKVTHIDGHSEESPMQVPLGTKTGIMSASQQTAAAQTFAKRYAFLNAFGIMTGDMDNDGANIPVDKNEVRTEKPAYNYQEKITTAPLKMENGNADGGQVVLSENGKQWIKNLENCLDAESFDRTTKLMNLDNKNGHLTEYDWQEIKKTHLITMTRINKPKSEAAQAMERGMAKAKQLTK